MNSINLKKTFLYTLIASVAFSALMGIWVILANEFSEFVERVLSTTLTVVLTSILGLACGAFWESPKSQKRGLKIVPILGIILTFVSAFISLTLIWQFIGLGENKILKTFAVSLIFAFSLSQLSLLSLANLSKKFQWALIAVYIAVLSLASLSSAIILLDTQNANEFTTRLLGILAVVDAALTVMIPIFHRLSRADFAATQISIQEIDEKIKELKDELKILEKQREEILNRQI
jgi:hypothetical protein